MHVQSVPQDESLYYGLARPSLRKEQPPIMTSSQSDPEKVVSTPAVALVEENSEEDIEKHGYALDAAALGNTGNLKLASDGHTILIPQPSSDPYDPLNWSQHKKHLILFIISACAFLPDYGSVTGNVVLLTQSKYPHLVRACLGGYKSLTAYDLGLSTFL